MKVCVIGGAGYVGLVTGLGFAEIGHKVTNVDINAQRVAMLSGGQSPIYEEGIEPLLRRNLDAGRITFTTEAPKAVRESDAVFIAVGTPSQSDGQADLSGVIGVAEDLLKYWNGADDSPPHPVPASPSDPPYRVIAVKSTVPVGTVELVRNILRREHTEGRDFDIVSNPEFLREGKGLYDFFYPDRIVIGAASERARTLTEDLYRPVIDRQVRFPDGNDPGPLDSVPVVHTDITSAQMIKYASNAFLATRVSFINEVAGVCERVGASIQEVARGIGYDPRIGPSYLSAGIGFGGPCLEKDLKALIKIAEANDYEPRVLRAVLGRNDRQVDEVMAKLKKLSGYLLYRKIVAVLGLSFKAGTNDARNSMSLKVVDRLRKEGARVQAYDPLAMEESREVQPDVDYCDDPYAAARHADAVLFLTDWPEFGKLDFDRLSAAMAGNTVIDARNFLDGALLRSHGLVYEGIGVRGG